LAILNLRFEIWSSSRWPGVATIAAELAAWHKEEGKAEEVPCSYF